MERVRRSVERDSVTLSATTSWLQSSLPIYGTVWAAVVIFPSCPQMPPPVSLMVVIVKMYFVCEANLQEDPRPPCSGVGRLVSLGHCWAEHRGQSYSGRIRALGGLWASPVNASSKVKAQPQRPVSSPGLFGPALWKRKGSCCSHPRPRSPAPPQRSSHSPWISDGTHSLKCPLHSPAGPQEANSEEWRPWPLSIHPLILDAGDTTGNKTDPNPCSCRVYIPRKNTI